MSLQPVTANPTDDKLAVVETLYRFAAGIDLRDRALLSSAFTENAISDFRPAAEKAGFEYPLLQGRDAIVEALSSSLGGLDTTHSISNPRVTLEGDSARVDMLVEAQHVSREDASSQYLMKNRYDVVLARQNAGWEIERMTVANVWRAGSLGVLGGV